MAFAARTACRLSVVLLFMAALACATPVVHSEPPRASEHKVTFVAVVPMPFEPFDPRDTLTGEEAMVASETVTARVATALVQWGGLEAVQPGDIQLWLRNVSAPSSPRRLGSELNSAFGVDAIMTGRVRRYSAREGGPRGASRPASVWFDLELRTPSGELLWEASYDEVQRSVSEDPGSFSRWRERGFRWVTPEELSRYGAKALMLELAEVRSAWR
jgi:hypothetical protein